MASNNIYLSHQIDTKKITYGKVDTNNYGGKFIKVLYEGRWLLLQTPRVYCPFGVSEYQPTDKEGNPNGRKTWSVELSFQGFRADPESESDEPANPKVKQFYDLICSCEQDSLLEVASANAYEWTGDADDDKALLKRMIRSNIRWSIDKETKKRNEKYPPRMKIDLPVWPDRENKDKLKMSFKAYVGSRSNQVHDIHQLFKLVGGKRCHVVVIARCDKVTFNDPKFGLKWIAQQIIFYPIENAMDNFAFVEDGADTHEEEVDMTLVGADGGDEGEDDQPALVESSSGEESGGEDEGEQHDLDQDVEEEEEEEAAPTPTPTPEPEPEPEPTPPKKKRRVRKKKTAE